MQGAGQRPQVHAGIRHGTGGAGVVPGKGGGWRCGAAQWALKDEWGDGGAGGGGGGGSRCLVWAVTSGRTLSTRSWGGYL